MLGREEEARLAALRELDLLDTAPSECFDRITRLACRMFDLPMAAISLTDKNRQWFKSRAGIETAAMPRFKAPCAEVARTTGMLVIPDLAAEPAYRDSPLLEHGIRFYAGAPLVTRAGFGLGSLCVLGRAPRRFGTEDLETLKDLAAIVMTQIKLQHNFSRVDPVSGLPNRNQFHEDLEGLMRESPDAAAQVAVAIDLADLEAIADAQRVFGHGFLDDLVRETAHTIRAIIGPNKTYHVGPTQFAFVSRADQQATIAVQGEAIRAALGRHGGAGRYRFVTKVSVGTAPLGLARVAPQDVLRVASRAAQDAGRSIGVYSAERDAADRRRFLLLGDFAEALEEGAPLRLAYQPRVDLATGLCRGAEALLRWSHPTFGEVSPGELMPLVERTALARPATAWVIERALWQLAAWRRDGLDLAMSINVSAANLEEDDLADRLAAAMRRHAVPPAAVELELTESAILRDDGQSLRQLESLAALGVRLAIDDFGTGYSSLSYLQRIPAQVIKIDQSFMRDLVADERDRALVQTMIKLSHDLGYRVVGEGVETAEVARLLKTYGCNEAQGYFFARPLAPACFVAWLAAMQGRCRDADPHAVLCPADVGSSAEVDGGFHGSSRGRAP